MAGTQRTTRRPTLNDLAVGLGLSANTVSRALTGKDGVSDRTRALVRAEAKRHGYVVDPDQAAGERTAARTIAVVIPSATHQFSAELIGAVEAGARSASYSLDLFTTDEDERQESQVASAIADGDVAGALIIPVQGRLDPWSALRESGLPLVTVSRDSAGGRRDLVAADNEAGSYAAARHLLGAGCRQLVQFEEDLQISTIDARRRGFDRALAEAPEANSSTILIPTRRFEATEPRWRAAEGYRACRDLLDAGRHFDAVVAGDDFFALGAMKALLECGVDVPGTVRVVGYGDHPYAAWLEPSLTSVSIPTRLIGELAVALLLQRMAEGPGEAVRRLVKPELIIRSSSARHG